MFDIYSLAKPRVFKLEPNDGGSGTPSETPAPDSVEYEFNSLNDCTGVISEEDAELSRHPEAAGRVAVELGKNVRKSINVINAASDFGGRTRTIINNPYSDQNDKVYRTEFRPKQGLHNLDFTTPAETPSDNPGGDDNTTQPTA